MVNFTVDEIRALMDIPTNIRNMSVIAHVDHGKSTLSDSLIAAAGIIAKQKAGDARFMQTRADEQERTITIKSSSVSLFFQMHKDDCYTLDLEAAQKEKEKRAANAAAEAKRAADRLERLKKLAEETGEPIDLSMYETPAAPAAQAAPADAPAEEAKTAVVSIDALVKDSNHLPFLINLIDSPGHVDFSSEVTAALRVTDGALVVVDCIEGVCVQTETVLRQAIGERIRPVLFVNKVDRCFLELMMDAEEIYQSFSRAVESVNVVISTYNDDLLGDVTVYPEKNTVGFGSGQQSWGFTIGVFAKMYASKFGVDKEKMMTRLWGESYFDAKRKVWTNKDTGKDGERLERAFCQFILKPIQTMYTAVMNDKKEVYEPLLAKLNVKTDKDASGLKGKHLLKNIMQNWLPASDTLMQMIVNHLPSPVVAQKYRLDNLYSGPKDDDAARAIRDCNPNGPLMLYVSKMFPAGDSGRFYAFGRVFAGRVATGQEVRIQGPEYIPGKGNSKNNDLYIKKIQRCVLLMGRYIEQLQDCPCGNIIGLVGVDQYLMKSGTITTYPEAHNFHTMKYSVSPVVRVAVEVVNAADLPKLIEGLKRLAKSDPLVQTITTKTGEHIVAGAGELHLEICLKDLREDFMKGAPLKTGMPVVSFCETVRAETSMTCISKSPNSHNRIYMTAEPLGDDLCKAIDEGDFLVEDDMKTRSRKLADEFGWDVTVARKIWSFGMAPDAIANCLIDNTKGVSFLNEVKDSMCTAFQQATEASVLCNEAMRNIKFNIQDVVLHADAIHRGAGQIMPPMKRVLYATILKSQPTLMEPVYLCDITVPQHCISGVYSTLNARRGVVEGKTDRPGTPLSQIKAYLPVLESFGFTQLLRQNTSGQAFPQMIFSHWQLLEGDCFEDGSQVQRIIMDVRKRKGMKEEMPEFNEYYDKI